MKILQSSQKNFAQLGINSSQSAAKNHPFNPNNLIVCILLGIYILFSWLFLYFDANDFKEYANCLFWTLLAIALAFVHIMHIYEMKNLFEFIRKFENLIHKRLSNPMSKEIYKTSNEQVEKWGKVLNFAIVYFTCLCVMLPMYIVCYVVYFTTDVGNEAFQLTYFMWFPFDWKNPVGFAFAYPIQCIMNVCLAVVATHMLVFLVGCCWWLISLAKDLTNDASRINEKSKSMKAKRKSAELEKGVIEFITFHSDAKQLVKIFSELYELILMDLFLFGVVAICVTLLMAQMEISQNEINLFDLMMCISLAFWSFAFIFMCCEFGERVSDGFNESYKIICQVDWYAYPMNVQRMFYMVMISVQRPVTIHSFGNIPCEREQVKKVFNGGFSYFTMLRKLGY